MREILFRGKRLNNSKWVEGYFFRQYGSNEIITADNEMYHIAPESVGEYTGLKDKNGKRIFEGDILSAHLDDAFPDEETRGCVFWNDYGWHIKIGARFYPLEQDWIRRYFKIIGNVHDNAELLEGEAAFLCKLDVDNDQKMVAPYLAVQSNINLTKEEMERIKNLLTKQSLMWMPDKEE